MLLVSTVTGILAQDLPAKPNDFIKAQKFVFKDAKKKPKSFMIDQRMESNQIGKRISGEWKQRPDRFQNSEKKIETGRRGGHL